MRITLAQVDSRLGDVDANVERAERVLVDAAQEGSDLVVFPELHLSGYSIGDVVDDPSIRQPDITLAKRELGWEPVVGYEDGLRRTIEWFRRHPELISS